MIQRIAFGLEVGHPFAYLLVFMLVGYPIICLLILGIVDLIDKWKKKNKK